jgi:hypothetical protein
MLIVCAPAAKPFFLKQVASPDRHIRSTITINAFSGDDSALFIFTLA